MRTGRYFSNVQSRDLGRRSAMSKRSWAAWQLRASEIQSVYADHNCSAAQKFDRLIAIFSPYLLAMAEGLVDSDLRPKAAASDLVQQTILEAWGDWTRFEP